jgi:hypothetical protein
MAKLPLHTPGLWSLIPDLSLETPEIRTSQAARPGMFIEKEEKKEEIHVFAHLFLVSV